MGYEVLRTSKGQTNHRLRDKDRGTLVVFVNRNEENLPRKGSESVEEM